MQQQISPGLMHLRRVPDLQEARRQLAELSCSVHIRTHSCNPAWGPVGLPCVEEGSLGAVPTLGQLPASLLPGRNSPLSKGLARCWQGVLLLLGQFLASPCWAGIPHSAWGSLADAPEVVQLPAGPMLGRESLPSMELTGSCSRSGTAPHEPLAGCAPRPAGGLLAATLGVGQLLVSPLPGEESLLSQEWDSCWPATCWVGNPCSAGSWLGDA